MENKNNIIIWKTLLSGCRIHGDVIRGEKIFKKAIEIDPMDNTIYVLMRNIYTIGNFYEKSLEIQMMMDKNGIRKIPGQSWGYLNGKLIVFVASDKTRNNWMEIQQQSINLSEKIQMIGYKPNFTHITNSEVKNDGDRFTHLCSHSERLLFTYLHSNTPPGEEIIMFKNLRICPDCHNAFKFLSKQTTRRIVMRDMNRFHHFENGLCSCKDHY